MAAPAIAGPLDLDDDGMVEQAVQQGRGDHGTAEHLAPLGKAAVGGQDHGAALVAGVTSANKMLTALPVRSNGFASRPRTILCWGRSSGSSDVCGAPTTLIWSL